MSAPRHRWLRRRLPPCQHIVLGIAAPEILRLLLTLQGLGQLVDPFEQIVGQLPGRNLSLGCDAALAFQALDHRIGEEAVAERGVLQGPRSVNAMRVSSGAQAKHFD